METAESANSFNSKDDERRWGFVLMETPLHKLKSWLGIRGRSVAYLAPSTRFVYHMKNGYSSGDHHIHAAKLLAAEAPTGS